MIIRQANNTLWVVERQFKDLLYGYIFGGAGIVLLLAGLFIGETVMIVVGVIFIGAGVMMSWSAETITTTMFHDGTITIEYKRLIGKKQWVRYLHKNKIRSLDYVKGFDERVSLISGRYSTIYLNTVFNEQIAIGSRYHVTWYLNKFGIPSSRHSIPIDSEANKIGNYLGIAVNVINYPSLASKVNVYIPHDKMAAIAQRPTQEQLNQERDMKNDASPTIDKI